MRISSQPSPIHIMIDQKQQTNMGYFNYVSSMRHIVICGLHGYTVFFHIISQTALSSKKTIIEHKMCFDFLYTFCLEYFLLLEEFNEI